MNGHGKRKRKAEEDLRDRDSNVEEDDQDEDNKDADYDHDHDDESSDSSESIRGNQRLPVAELPRDFDGIPLDGSQYLAIVRREAQAARAVVRITPPRLLSGEEVEQSRESTPPAAIRTSCMPSSEWIDAFMVKFRTMRANSEEFQQSHQNERVKKIPTKKNAREWYIFLHGSEPSLPVEATDAKVLTGADSQDAFPALLVKPTPRLINLQLSSLQRIALLQAFTVWIDGDWSKQGNCIPAEYSRFVFALLCILEERLHGDDLSTLRDLARACLKCIKGSKVKDENAGIWIIFTAIANYWHQDDLWIEAEAAAAIVASKAM